MSNKVIMHNGKLTISLYTKYCQTGSVCVFKFKTYQHIGAPCLLLLDWITNDVVMRVTVNLTRKPPKECIWIKDWAENEGIVKALIDAELIQTPTFDREFSGHAEICAYHMKNELLDLYNQFVQGKEELLDAYNQFAEGASK